MLKKKELGINIFNIEIMQISSITNILLKWKWHLNPINNKIAINLELPSVKKY